MENLYSFDVFGWSLLFRQYPQSIMLLLTYHGTKPISFEKEEYFLDWVIKKEFYSNPVLLKDFFEQNGVNFKITENCENSYGYIISVTKEVIISPTYSDYDFVLKRLISNSFMLLEKRLNEEKKIIN